MGERISVKELDRLPVPDEAEVDRLLQAEIQKSGRKLVVLDDDPTGVQTVHDVSVYTSWDEAAMTEGFREPGRIFYILTNSRGMTREETIRVHREILASAEAASRATGKDYAIISRSDSTLRGHFPLEGEVLREGLEKLGHPVDGEILLPYFREGGRFTLNDIHYVQYGDELVPAADTEFAKDRTFGYQHSDLPGYIEEKTKGAYPAAGVVRISLEDLRAMELEKMTAQLMGVTDFGKVCVNCAKDIDVKVFCIALYRALSQGKRFLFRTAAAFVKAVGGISDRPLLTRADMVTLENGNGGVIVVGSHTAKTTAQLSELLKLPELVPVSFRSSAVLEGPEAFDAEVARCVAEEEKIIRSGRTSVCFTERKVLDLPGDTPEAALERSVRISDGVQRMVADLRETPAFIIAKGGITSSDVGTKALRVRRADVLGQIRPGVPVWRTGAESRFPGTPYVIFPGNVGQVETLREAAQILLGQEV